MAKNTNKAQSSAPADAPKDTDIETTPTVPVNSNVDPAPESPEPALASAPEPPVEPPKEPEPESPASPSAPEDVPTDPAPIKAVYFLLNDVNVVTRVFTKDIHGENFLAIADEFALNNLPKILKREDAR